MWMEKERLKGHETRDKEIFEYDALATILRLGDMGWHAQVRIWNHNERSYEYER